MADNKQLLSDFVATAYKDGDVNSAISKFPELKSYDKKLLSDFVATAYNDGDVSSAWNKFPEFHVNTSIVPTPEEFKNQQSASGNQQAMKPSSENNFSFLPEPKTPISKQDKIRLGNFEAAPMNLSLQDKNKGMFYNPPASRNYLYNPSKHSEENTTGLLEDNVKNNRPSINKEFVDAKGESVNKGRGIESEYATQQNNYLSDAGNQLAASAEIKIARDGNENNLTDEERYYYLQKKQSELEKNVQENENWFERSTIGNYAQKLDAGLAGVFGSTFDILDKGAEAIGKIIGDKRTRGERLFGQIADHFYRERDWQSEGGNQYGYVTDADGTRRRKDFTDLWKEGDIVGAANELGLGATESAAYSIAAVGATALGHPELGISYIGALSANEKYNQLSEENPSMREDLKIANSLLTGAIEGGTEMIGSIPLGKIFKNVYKIGGQPFFSKMAGETVEGVLKNARKQLGYGALLKASSGEGVEEMVSGIGTNFTDMLTGVESWSVENLFKDVAKQAAYGFVGGMQGGSMALPGVISNTKTRKSLKIAEQEYKQAQESLGKAFDGNKNIINPKIFDLSIPEIEGWYTQNIENGSLTDIQKSAILDYLSAGVMAKGLIVDIQAKTVEQTIKDINLAQKEQEATQFIQGITHSESGNVIEAQLRGVEQPINITKGNIVQKEDGTVDAENSDKIFFYKTPDGQLHIGNTDFIENINNVMPATQAIEESLKPLQQELQNENAPQYAVGSKVVIIDNTDPVNPQNVIAQITGRNNDGTYRVQRDTGGGKIQQGIVEPREILPQFEGVLDTENAAVDYTDPQSGQQQTGIIELDTADKQIMFANGYAIIKGKAIPFENIIGVNSEQTTDNRQQITDNLQNNETNGLQATEAGNAPEELGKDRNRQSLQESTDLATPTATESQEPRAKSQDELIPTDEKGNLLFEQARPELTIQFLQDNFEKEEIVPTVEARINAINKEISRQEAFKPSGNIQKDALAKQAKKQALSALNEQLGYWGDIKERVTPRNYKPKNETVLQRNTRWGEPVSLRELIIRKFIGGLRLRWEDEVSDNGSIISRGLGAEYRYDNNERKSHFSFISGTGVTPEQLAHTLWEANAYEPGQFEDMPLYGMDTQEILSEVLDVMNSYRSIGEMIKAVDEIRDQYSAGEQAYIDALVNDVENQNNVLNSIENEIDDSIFAQIAGVVDLTEEQQTELQNIQNNVTNTGATATVIGSDNENGGQQQSEAGTRIEPTVTGRTVDAGGNTSGDRGAEGVDKSTVNSQQTTVASEEQPTQAQLDTQALDAEIAAQIHNNTPTEKQKETGIYDKARINVQGYNITLETLKGEQRSGTDSNGKAWAITMNNHYGELDGTTGYDGDAIDVFVGPNPKEGGIWVVDQVTPKSPEGDFMFDESKVMLGFDSAEEAKAAYMSNYEEGWQGFGNITPAGDKFKQWLYDGKKQRKTFSEYVDTPEAVESQEPRAKSQEDIRFQVQKTLSETITVDGVERPTINSNGKPIHSTEELIRNFWRWFGDSKVVDENGRPLVCYHNSERKFNVFDIEYSRTSADIQAFYFKGEKDPYKEYGENEYPVYLKIKNPADYKQAVSGFIPSSTDNAGIDQRKKLESEGFDGFIMSKEDSEMDYTEIGVFLPTQIKSATENDGTFDSENADIRFQIKQENANRIDEQYFASIERGDMEEAQRIVDQQAANNGYISANDYRDAHRAPGAEVDKAGFRNLDVLREIVEEDGWDTNLYALANGISKQPDDYFSPQGARWYGYDNAQGYQSASAIRSAMRDIQSQLSEFGEVKEMPLITVYRAVQKSLKEGSIRNGDWVTPSLLYAQNHGKHRLGYGEYRIIKEDIPADNLWWDGNDVNEWGVDDGNGYAYKDTKNNKKLTDVIVRDDNGEIIPPSKRFNQRINDVRFQAISPIGFYSTVESALDKIQQEKGSKEQFRAMLLKNGAKQAEMDWMGFDELPEKLTKADIQDWIDENRIEVKEVELSQENSDIRLEYSDELTDTASERKSELEDAIYEYEKLDRLDLEVDEHFDRYDEISNKYNVESKDNAESELWELTNNIENYLIEEVNYGEDNTKFSQYVLPGGENYKELLLTMPEKLGLSEKEKAEKETLGRRMNNEINMPQSDIDRYNELERKSSKRIDNNFKSSHFDEPNILAHVRFDEREVNGERVLFIEEFQSDWSQKIKKEGEKLPEDKLPLIPLLEPSKMKITESQYQYHFNYNNRTYDVGKGVVSNPIFAKEYFANMINKDIEHENDIIKTNNKYNKILASPFKKTDQWLNLAARRMMRYAAENGFDRIAWTTGEQQADRYDLAKQVDRIVVDEDGGKYSVMARPIGKTDLEEITVATKENLSDYIGKELATKSIEDGGGDFSGNDLKVGGAGMKAFYDGIVPAAMSKLGKPFGAKVETIDMPETGEQQSIPVTDSMKQSVMEGIPLFQTTSENSKKFDASRTAEEKYAAGKAIIEQLDAENGRQTEVVGTLPRLIELLPESWKPAALEIIKKGNTIGGVKIGERVVVNTEAHGNTDKLLLAYEHEHGHVSTSATTTNKELGELWNNVSESDKALVPKAYYNNPDWVKGDELISYAIEDIIEKQGYEAYKNGEIDLSSYSEPLQQQLKKVTEHANKEFRLKAGRRNAGRNNTDIDTSGKTIGDNGRTGNAGGDGRGETGLAEQSAGDVQGTVHGRSAGVLQSPLNNPQGDLIKPQYTPGKSMVEYAKEVSAWNNRKQLPATIDVDGVERPTTNSTGKQIHSTEEGIRNFWRWFGDSKVVDENGRPLVVYHGTISNFDTFDLNHAGKGTDSGVWGKVFYFSNDPKYSNTYAERKGISGSVMPVYLSIKNPLITNKNNQGPKIDVPNSTMEDLLNGPENYSRLFREKLIEQGNDGVIAYGDEFVVFDPKQIKSATGNDGSFDPNEADIRNQIIGERGAAAFDAAEEASTRLDNLEVAREMEGGTIDKYYVDKTYGFDTVNMKGGFYLRFTEDPFADIEHKYSRWYDTSLNEKEAKEQGYIKDESGEFYKPHTGLSGHYLKAENLEDAIKEVEAKKWWFRESDKDNWAIFEANEDDYNVVQDTPEGNTFRAEKVLFYRKFNTLDVAPEDQIVLMDGMGVNKFALKSPKGELPATIDVNGVERPTSNSNGKPIHGTEEGVRNFWKWFGDSKVVDKDGRPLVVYHGSISDFNEFKLMDSDVFGTKFGHFFTPDKDIAKIFADRKENGVLYATYLKMEQPKKINGFFWDSYSRYKGADASLRKQSPKEYKGGVELPDFKKFREQLQSEGNDGVILNNISIETANKKRIVKTPQYIVFDPNQIKSATGNEGTFSADDNDIRFQIKIPKGELKTGPEFYQQVQSIDELKGIGKPVHNKKGGEPISEYYKRVKAWSVANNPESWDEVDRQEVADFIAGKTPDSYEAKAQRAEAAATEAGATVVDKPKPVFQQDGHANESIGDFAKRVVAWREVRFINGIVRAEREEEARAAEERGDTPIDHEIARMQLDMELRTVYDSLGKLIGKESAKKLERFAGNKEMWADSLLPVKTFLEYLRKSGMKIPDIDNYYMQATALQGKNDTGFNNYVRKYQKPINKWIKATVKATGLSYRDIENYVFLKHGVERNEYFKKDGKHQKADYAGVYAIAVELYAKENGIPFDPKEKNEIGKVLREYAKANDIILKESSEQGIYDELFQNKEDVVAQATVNKTLGYFDNIIKNYVLEFENESNGKGRSIDEFWQKLNAANDFSIDTMADGGIITREQAAEIKSRYRYFIPLRGHEVEAEKTYEYTPDAGVFFSNPAIKARGRMSRGESPFAYIAQMAQSSVVMTNKNNLNKTLLRLARRDKTGLLTTNKTWYIKTSTDAEGNDIWEEAEIEAKPFDELNRAEWEAWNTRMKELEKDGRARQFTKGVDLDGLFIKKKQKKQHAITVVENGEEYQVYINANPRISRAINGLNKSEQNAFYNFLSKTKGMIGLNITSRNPAFMAANFTRDTLFAASTLPAKEGGVYAAKYIANIGIAAKELAQYQINPDTAPEYVKEFFDNGGETGYSHLWELQDMQKEVDKAVETGMSASKAWDAITMPIDLINKIVENTTRMAVYKTSRESGRTIERSVSDAKEVSLNFNRSGAGGGIVDFVRSSYLFVNAGVQALNNFTGLYKAHPWKMSAVVLGYAMSGLLMPLINSGAGDDDDEYWNLPEYERQNNLCIWTGSGFIKIPLPQELRVFYRMGDNIASMIWNKEAVGKAMVNTIEGMLDLIPAEPSGAVTVSTVELVPDAFKPFAQVYWSNQTFTGAAIAKDKAFMKEGVPQYRQVRTNRANEPKAPAGIIWLSATLNAALGGDQYRSAGAFEKEVLNPDRMNHLARGYFGGVYTTAMQGVGTITDRFYMAEKDLNEKTTGNNLQKAYDKIDEAEQRVNQFNQIVKDLQEGKIDRLQFAKDTVGYNFGEAKRIQKLGSKLQDINKAIKENQELPEAEMQQLKEAQKTILKMIEESP